MNTDHLKTKLLEEKAQLEVALGHLGKKNPENPKDWLATSQDPTHEATPEDTQPEADPLDMAERIEEFEGRFSAETNLETRLFEVNRALEAMASGSYGTCAVGDGPHPIEPERLEANPAAITCISHR